MSRDESPADRLDARLQQYHGVTMTDVLEMIAYLRNEGDSIIVGGSLALGLGNRLSDLDVVVAGRETPASQVPLEHWLKSLRVDVWMRAQRNIDALFQRAEAALASDAPVQGSFGSVDEEQELKLLHRVAFGLHWHGPELVPSTRNYRAVARDLLVREYAERMRESAYVAQLAASAGREVAAAVNARLTVEEALQAVLAAQGLPWTGDKWLQTRLASEAPELDELYRPFAVLPEEPDDGFVIGAVELAQRLTGMELSMDALAADVRWSISSLSLVKLGDRRVLASLEDGALWEFGEGQLATWETLAERGGADGELRPALGLSADEAKLCFHLYERGIGSIVWSHGVRAAELTTIAEVSA